MATDILSEARITLPEAAALVGVNIGTLHRWRLKGVRGVKLSCFLIAGRRYTSRDRLNNFIHATTAAFDGRPDKPDQSSGRTPSQRKRAADQAEKALAEAGI